MKSATLFLAFAALPSVSLAALGEVVCDDTSRLTHDLAQDMGAHRQGMGVRDPDTIMEMWVDPRTGDWTLVQQYANGTACVVAMGQHWETLKPAADPS